jgi:tRNA(adenine34) deaminase
MNRCGIGIRIIRICTTGMGISLRSGCGVGFKLFNMRPPLLACFGGANWPFGTMKTSGSDTQFMQRAIGLAQAAARSGSGAPIGSVIALEGEVVGEGHNDVEAGHDPTAHAEIMAIRKAGEKLRRSRFEGATMYSTLQPCGMCTMAAIWAGVSRIVYGAEDRNLDITDYVRDAFKEDLTLTGGVLGGECAAFYYKPGDDPPEQEQANK